MRVEVDGVIVAESDHPTLLFETGLPVRYYFPKPDVRLDLLVPDRLDERVPATRAPRAYWSVVTNGNVHADWAWCYDYPLPESIRIAGLIAFYNERVDLSSTAIVDERFCKTDRKTVFVLIGAIRRPCLSRPESSTPNPFPRSPRTSRRTAAPGLAAARALGPAGDDRRGDRGRHPRPGRRGLPDRREVAHGRRERVAESSARRWS